MNEGWLELESDPGLFTLLVEEFGVTGIQVEEIYDLQKPIEGPVFGFIFLFKWIEERRARRKMSPSDEAFVSDAEVVNSMFFAQQIVPNSCATHALLSVLLNCSDINLGQTLLSLKTFSKNFTPESKGYAIGNVAQIAKVHNSHAHPEPKKVKEKQSGIATTNRTHEAFHFVSYVPINGRLFELDGLKPYPIDHGPWGDHEEWTEKFRRVIAERLDNEGGSSDIRFNLMAVVADRRIAYEQRLGNLRTNKQVILDALEQLMHVNRPQVTHQGKSRHSPKKSHKEKSKPATEKIKISEPPLSSTATTKAVTESKSSKDAAIKIESSGESTTSSEEGAGVQKEQSEVKEVIQIEDGGDAALRDEQVKKKKKALKVKIKTTAIPQPYRLPAALDSHNYAKSPLESDEESLSEYITESDVEETDGKSMSSSSSSSNSSSSSSSSSGTETDSESSAEDKMEIESDARPVEDGAKPQEDKSDEVTAEPQPESTEVKSEEKVPEQEPEPPPPKTEGILKKQGADSSEKSDSPALRVTFSDAHEEKEVENDDSGGCGGDDDDDDDIQIIDSTVPADITKPLTIQTVFENGPPSPASSNYSTDTASDAGSAFNSPIRSANHSRSVSPNSVKQIKFKEWKTNVISEARAKLEATIMEMDQKDEAAAAIAKKIPVATRQGAHMGTRSKVAKAAAAASVIPHTRQSSKRSAEQTSGAKGAEDRSKMSVLESDQTSQSEGSILYTETWKPPRPSFLVSQNGKQPFAPRDLLELLKSVESEIEIYEQKLDDETEKRHKYKIDDCRRTHNYDPFICTFLTMLAEQGKLSALVEKHTVIKRRQGISLGQLQKSRKRDRRRSRSRPKKTKLK